MSSNSVLVTIAIVVLRVKSPFLATWCSRLPENKAERAAHRPQELSTLHLRSPQTIAAPLILASHSRYNAVPALTVPKSNFRGNIWTSVIKESFELL